MNINGDKNKKEQEQKSSAPVFVTPLIIAVVILAAIGFTGTMVVLFHIKAEREAKENSSLVAQSSERIVPENHRNLVEGNSGESENDDSEEHEPSEFELAFENVQEPFYDAGTLGMVEDIFSEADFLDLNQSDLEVTYEGNLINRDTPYKELSDDLEKKTGIGLSKGYSSRANKELEFYAYHPGYYEYKIGLDYHNFNAADECLATIDISGMGTVRGLKRGDAIERVAGLYGRPQRIGLYTDKTVWILYGGAGGALRIVTDKTAQRVEDIFIEYNCEQYIFEEPNLEDWQVAYLHKVLETQDLYRKKVSADRTYEVMKYMLCDVNRDYIPELVIYSEKISADNKITMSFYTFEEGELKHLGDVRTPWKDFYRDDQGLIVSYTGIEDSGDQIKMQTDNFDRIRYNPFKQQMVAENIYSGVFRYTKVEKASENAVKLTEYPIDYVLAISEYETKSDTATKKKGDIKLLYDYISQENGIVYGIDTAWESEVGEMSFVDFVCLMGSRHFGLMEPIKYTDVDINKDGQVERIVILEKGMIILNYQDDEVYAYYVTEGHAPDLEIYYETTDGKGRAFWIYGFNGENHYARFYFNRTEFLKEEPDEKTLQETAKKLDVKEYNFGND